MSATSGGSYDCQLCQNTYDSKVALTVHFCKHLSYKKYPCNSCRDSFYTEDDRGEHCQKANHDNMYTLKSSPYCEMIINQLLKDAKLLTIYDLTLIVAKRAKKNFEFEHELRDCEQKVKKESPRTPRKSSPRRKSEPSPSPMARKSSPTLAKARKDHSPSKERKDSDKAKNRKEAKVKGILKRAYSETASEETNGTATKEEKRKRNSSQAPETPKRAADPPLAPISQLPDGSDIKFPCGLCNRKVPSDYVSRKDHVSRKHMDTDHSDEDYVPILEAQMKKAFLDWTHSDLDCQLCRKQYRTISGRREHVAKNHLPERLSCPMEGCHYSSEITATVNKHLKQSHNLEEGYKSMEDDEARKAFEEKYKHHNQLLHEITKHCYPCSIPQYYLATKKTATPKSTETPLLSVSRIFQSAPMGRPLRRQSESSDSDGGTHHHDPVASPETAETDTAENDDESPLIFDSEDIKNVQPIQERGLDATTEEWSQQETPNPLEEEEIIFVREKNKKKKLKEGEAAVKVEVEDVSQINLPPEPGPLLQFTLPRMGLPPTVQIKSSYSPDSLQVPYPHRSSSPLPNDQQYGYRSQNSRSPRSFHHKEHRDSRSRSASRRDRGGYHGSHIRLDERRSSENHANYTLQRERSVPRGNNHYSYGYRVSGRSSDRFSRDRHRDGDRHRDSREPDRGQDDNRHYRNPSGQRPNYSIMPK